MDKNKVLELCMDVRYNKSVVEGQTPDQRKAELNALFADLLAKGYDRSKIEINEIIKVNIDELLPKRVEEALSIIADIATVGHGQKKEFWVKNGKITASYEALGTEIRRRKIYKKKIEMNPVAIGASTYCELNDILTGNAEYFTSIIDEMTNAIMEKIMLTVESTFVAAMAAAPALNLYAGVFNLSKIRDVCNTIKAYGNPILVGTGVGLGNITSDNQFRAIMSDSMKADFNRTGYIGTWEGKPLVELPNSFTDITNVTWVLDNDYIYVVPSLQDKTVKTVLEGGSTILEEQDFDTGQVTKKVLQKVGVKVLQVHNAGLVTLA